MFRPVLIALLLMSYGPSLMAEPEPEDVYSFDTREQEERFQNLTSELRCPKCQNQNIADSNAPISKDMRAEVYLMMSEGASNEEIVGALVGRFGEFVRYKPEVDRRTILLWATPVIAVVIGLLVVATIVIRARRYGDSEPTLSNEERARASRILAGDDSDRAS
ncbi:cytochrome c-type biogenesis protein CcmH [Marinobacter vulgaris]|uniref:Cytochrome c-type biogenesis protein n=1 Tax=Marinobacter vulgaris TaxID=1928331 RepID=A0A2V3ZKB5_9GAMM|nr:cytochrome c-type biogenesis protein [Marinobacter vulgaris]PXX90989.1 cytochrome c-type biogenesis protein CcmH [Marinobacter vulgaris]TSJ70028.1 cytochrome c-type biogenesis protein CcmH [Marinobacter vulgaris]